MKLTSKDVEDLLAQEEQEFSVPNRLAKSIARDHVRQQENLNALQAKRSESQDYSSKKKNHP